MVPGVEGVTASLVDHDAVGLPELADVGKQRKAARVPGLLEVGGIFGRAVYQVPLRNGQEGLLRVAAVFGGRVSCDIGDA